MCTPKFVCMNIHERLKMIIDHENILVSKFERIIGVRKNSVSTCFRRESVIGHNVLQGLCKYFPNHSIQWILSGKESNNKMTKNKIK